MRVRWRALRAVIYEARPVWILVAGIIVACLIGRLAAGPSAAVRWAGLVLQLLGLAAVALGLRQTRQLFGAPTIGRRAWVWFGRLRQVFRRPQPIVGRMSITGPSAVVHGRGRGRYGAGVDATIERRLEALEANVKSLEKEFDETMSELNTKIGRLKKDLETERVERKTADDKTSKQIEEVAIGGLHLEVVGLLWLGLGVVGTSIPDELANTLGRVLRP